jgi:hypothetical protein
MKDSDEQRCAPDCSRYLILVNSEVAIPSGHFDFTLPLGRTMREGVERDIYV